MKSLYSKSNLLVWAIAWVTCGAPQAFSCHTNFFVPGIYLERIPADQPMKLLGVGVEPRNNADAEVFIDCTTNKELGKEFCSFFDTSDEYFNIFRQPKCIQKDYERVVSSVKSGVIPVDQHKLFLTCLGEQLSCDLLRFVLVRGVDTFYIGAPIQMKSKDPSTEEVNEAINYVVDHNPRYVIVSDEGQENEKFSFSQTKTTSKVVTNREGWNWSSQTRRLRSSFFNRLISSVARTNKRVTTTKLVKEQLLEKNCPPQYRFNGECFIR